MDRRTRVFGALALIAVTLVVLFLPIVVEAQASPAGEVPDFDWWLWTAGSTGSAMLAGVAISIALDVIPGLREWHDKCTRIQKLLIFAAMCTIIPIGFGVTRVLAGYATWDFETTFWPMIYESLAGAGLGTIAHGRTYVREG